LLSLVAGIAGERKAKKIFPYIATFFLFILLSNWFGLLPGVGTILTPDIHTHKLVPLLRGATADLNITLGLALVSVYMTQVVGVRNLGLGYFKKFIDISNPIKFFIGVLEMVAEFAKILSFAFRLFGNIFAGEVLLVVMASIVPIIAPLPFIGLEIFVGLVQALVFAMLTLVFMNLATISHSEEVN
jgi:F-type H+-transporting ATPase subunit a